MTRPATTTPATTAGHATEDGVLIGDAVAIPEDTLVHAVARHAAQRPDRPAIVHDGAPVLTYAGLWEEAGRIAGVLAEAGVGRGDLVAVWATRSRRVVAAMIATMGLGAAYVPIDPSYPPARVRRILEVASPPVVLCADGSVLSGACPSTTEVIDLDAAAGGPAWRLDDVRTDDTAYVVFTSGTAGRPKGVRVGHRSLLNYLHWARALTRFGPGDVTPCFASLGFDHAVTCLWLPLLAGGTVHLVADSWDPRPWIGPGAGPFRFVKITPSHAQLFERVARPDYDRFCRLVMFGGERLDPELVGAMADRLGNLPLLNHYGPTEATVGCCAHPFTAAEAARGGPIPIGRPVWNSRAYVVDGDGRPLAPGEEGELVMGGACVADGYVGAGAGDEQRFFAEERLGAGFDGAAYRTGDWAVVTEAGLHCLGRVDDQLKVRGHRVEAGEIRDLALAVSGVSDARAHVNSGGIGAVELFVVPLPGHGRDLAPEVRAALGQALPPAVVPTRVWVVPRLAVNAHGKWDAEATRHLAGNGTGAEQ